MVSKDTRRKLSVHVTGAKEKSQQQEPATDSEGATSGQSAEPSTTTASEEPAAAADTTVCDGAGTENGDSPDMVKTSEVADKRVQLIKDIWAFKRSQMLYPSVK